MEGREEGGHRPRPRPLEAHHSAAPRVVLENCLCRHRCDIIFIIVVALSSSMDLQSSSSATDAISRESPTDDEEEAAVEVAEKFSLVYLLPLLLLRGRSFLGTTTTRLRRQGAAVKGALAHFYPGISRGRSHWRPHSSFFSSVRMIKQKILRGRGAFLVWRAEEEGERSPHQTPLRSATSPRKLQNGCPPPPSPSLSVHPSIHRRARARAPGCVRARASA